MKPHRIYRHSRHVSSETGTAIAAMIGELPATKYSQAKTEILTVLRRLPPGIRRTLIVDVLKDIEREM